MRPARALAIGIFVVAIGLSTLLLNRNDEHILKSETQVEQLIERESSAQRPISESTVQTPSTQRPAECIPTAKLAQSPVAYRIDEWYKSWGAPPAFNSELGSRPYAGYQQRDLEGLFEAGDAEAAHEMGRDLVWSALHGGRGMPDYQTLWEIGGDEFPYTHNVDMKKLERGREHLYKAALEGRIYALIEISLSYAHEGAAARKNGELDNKQETAMQIEAFAYGEAVEQLIVGLPSNFFQASVPEGVLNC